MEIEHAHFLHSPLPPLSEFHRERFVMCFDFFSIRNRMSLLNRNRCLQPPSMGRGVGGKGNLRNVPIR